MALSDLPREVRQHPFLASKGQRSSVVACTSRGFDFFEKDGQLRFRFAGNDTGTVSMMHDRNELLYLPSDEPAQVHVASLVVRRDENNSKRLRPRLLLRCITPQGTAFRLMVVNPEMKMVRDLKSLLHLQVECFRPLMTVSMSRDSSGAEVVVAELVKLSNTPVEGSRLAPVKQPDGYRLPKLRAKSVLWSAVDPQRVFCSGVTTSVHVNAPKAM